MEKRAPANPHPLRPADRVGLRGADSLDGSLRRRRRGLMPFADAESRRFKTPRLRMTESFSNPGAVARGVCRETHELSCAMERGLIWLRRSGSCGDSFCKDCPPRPGRRFVTQRSERFLRRRRRSGPPYHAPRHNLRSSAETSRTHKSLNVHWPLLTPRFGAPANYRKVFGSSRAVVRVVCREKH